MASTSTNIPGFYVDKLDSYLYMLFYLYYILYFTSQGTWHVDIGSYVLYVWAKGSYWVQSSLLYSLLSWMHHLLHGTLSILAYPSERFSAFYYIC